jgi:hypothetical protein
MHENVERDTLDLRYQDYRMRDDDREARLLAAIAQRGIEEPLEGVDTDAGRVLLNGFKRCRCAEKLHLNVVPYVSLAGEEAEGILQFMRTPADKKLGILEQARFVTELLTVHGMTPADVALALGRSKGWVSMRRTLLDEISPEIQQLLFAGKFPVYCYMYTLQPFMRMNGVGREEIDGFIRSVAGKRLSACLSADRCGTSNCWPPLTSADPTRCGKRSTRESSTGRSTISRRCRTTWKAATNSNGCCSTNCKHWNMPIT